MSATSPAPFSEVKHQAHRHAPPLRLPARRPAPALTGQFIGLDSRGGLYVLRWEPRERCWIALGFETGANTRELNWPHIVFLRGKDAQHIVSHAGGPEITQGNALASEGKEHG